MVTPNGRSLLLPTKPTVNLGFGSISQNSNWAGTSSQQALSPTKPPVRFRTNKANVRIGSVSQNPSSEVEPDYLIGGWQFSGITTVESGLPFSPTLINTASINADIPSPDFRPDRVPGIDPYDVPGGKSRDRWFNPAAYRIPGPFLFGNAGRNSLRGPNLFTADGPR